MRYKNNYCNYQRKNLITKNQDLITLASATLWWPYQVKIIWMGTRLTVTGGNCLSETKLFGMNFPLEAAPDFQLKTPTNLWRYKAQPRKYRTGQDNLFLSMEWSAWDPLVPPISHQGNCIAKPINDKVWFCEFCM